MTRVVAAAISDYLPALDMLFSRLPLEARRSSIADVLRAMARGRIVEHGLLLAFAETERRGVTLYLMQEDRTAFVWTPRMIGPDTAPIADLLLQELIRRIDTAGAWIGQSLVEIGSQEDRAALARNGFCHLTDLQFLMCDLETLPPLEPASDAELERVAFQPGVNEDQFARLLEQTYVETHDCPELEGLRTGEQAIVSHRMSGSPAQWNLYRWRGAYAGVLLLNDHAQQNAWELVYMGVAKEFRGRGLGRAMLIDGLNFARTAGRAAVILAVDCRNGYARRLYEELGFHETDQKAVHVYFPRGRSRPLANHEAGSRFPIAAEPPRPACPPDPQR